MERKASELEFVKNLDQNKGRKKAVKKKTDEDVDNSQNSDNAEMVVEIEVDKLQKNNESEFFLDEDFYERLADDFNKKQNPASIHHSDIQIEDKISSHKTEDEDNLPQNEEDEGMNPLAQTHDGKGLLRMLQRDRLNTNAEENHESPPENNQDNDNNEESKRMSVSISNDNLEIRLDQNAPPRFGGTAEVRPSFLRKSLLQDSDEEEKENAMAKSYDKN
mmetsp:Transcript_19735/g.17446  ORF Transcript_19735/g.17446 Transcript_19735/m.17446 type:complete len:219 (+) Transcript_19735:62-718(+)|eukprot:CAMPEP_0205806216 /NCGR_PEP_ID=MMETSP0205-20121125/9663_1 /ASSEMBLY_ACC=CAM_ASM_000278 /TAXON_ID=36767 /ORGANISM="Euplotes focardii, Strain TN1" /LENGTH=218 /DNA_ID=CAMNT_0053078659 /DNA_START=177 /DNA_END=833 /DNA_ORIENTATION=-